MLNHSSFIVILKDILRCSGALGSAQTHYIPPGYKEVAAPFMLTKAMAIRVQ